MVTIRLLPSEGVGKPQRLFSDFFMIRASIDLHPRSGGGADGMIVFAIPWNRMTFAHERRVYHRCGRRSAQQPRRSVDLRDERPEVFDRWLSLVTRAQVRGKRSHDARLAALALSHGVAADILTLNTADCAGLTGIRAIRPSAT